MRERASKAARSFRPALFPLLVVALLFPVAACSRGTRTETVTKTVTQTVTQTVTETVVQMQDAPNETLWASSAHADKTAEAFNHWTGTIPGPCAICHSSPGYQDFLGADGTTAGVLDNPAPTGTVIDCDACHNSATATLSSVTFPSGNTITGLGPSARCMVCHQGRESTVSVDAAIAAQNPANDDTVIDQGFINVHYLAAGATLYGRLAEGAYEYTDETTGDKLPYDAKFTHVSSMDTCIACHDPHSLKVRIDKCGRCHSGVTTEADLQNIRMNGSTQDYNGNGNTTEGIAKELSGLADILYSTIQQYATKVVGTGISYDTTSYPYWFVDDNGNGVHDPDETTAYDQFTPRLLRATYNLHYYYKDPGAFAHNAKYMIEILYDSIADLAKASGMSVPILSKLHRNDFGHFDGADQPFHHWDSKGAVDVACARCHSIEGFDFRAEYGIDITVPTPLIDGFSCETCHVKDTSFATSPALKYIPSVTFPSGETIDNDSSNPDTSFICMTCHQGRESTVSVNDAVSAGTYKFLDVHYLPAGATLYGDVAKGAYEYTGKTYVGKWGHFNPAAPEASACAFCHLKDHSFKPQISDNCKGCHVEVKNNDITTIRMNRSVDYDGNGNSTTETLEDEVGTFAQRLYTAMQDYAKNTLNDPIVFSDSYPYFFKDTNGNGTADPAEIDRNNSYDAWDAKLMEAAYNYQYWHNEPGAWAHNTYYILEVLYDSIQDLGGDVTGLTRP